MRTGQQRLNDAAAKAAVAELPFPRGKEGALESKRRCSRAGAVSGGEAYSRSGVERVCGTTTSSPNVEALNSSARSTPQRRCERSERSSWTASKMKWQGGEEAPRSERVREEDEEHMRTRWPSSTSSSNAGTCSRSSASGASKWTTTSTCSTSARWSHARGGELAHAGRRGRAAEPAIHRRGQRGERTGPDRHDPAVRALPDRRVPMPTDVLAPHGRHRAARAASQDRPGRQGGRRRRRCRHGRAGGRLRLRRAERRAAGRAAKEPTHQPPSTGGPPSDARSPRPRASMSSTLA